MGYVVKAYPSWKKLEYPKFRFFILTILGAYEFVKEAKRQIDAINHVREAEWHKRHSKPPVAPRGQSGVVYPIGHKFDSNDIYILPNAKKLNNIYSKNLEEMITNYAPARPTGRIMKEGRDPRKYTLSTGPH